MDLDLISLDDRYCMVYKSQTLIPTIQTGETAEVKGNFSLFIKPSTPPFTPLPLVFSLKQDNTTVLRDSITLTTCGHLLEDECDSVSFWQVRDIVGTASCHITGYNAHSMPSSWKCGAQGAGDYPNMMDTALQSPPLCLGENSNLSFWHRISAEAGSSYPYWAEDAGVVEISTDGGDSWEIISPLFNYPCRASSGNTIFLDPYQRCYSGESDWEFQEFDLSSYTGPVIIRFHFASNEQYGFGGWFIDDIQISTEVYTGTDTPPADANRMLRARPNPFNPTTSIPFQVAGRSRARLQVFDVRGRLVKTLFDRSAEPGMYECTWHGKNDRGAVVASGVYLCRLQVGGFQSTQRLVLLR
jgi:hypothetical protein